MKPYYQHAGVTIYHGDAREVLPHLSAESIITDPVWPNATAKLAGAERPFSLFREVARLFPRVAKRAAIHLGCDTDPRFLRAIPASMPFIRTCWLEYACPHYKGRILYTADVAYVFGEVPESRPGAHLIPGKCLSATSNRLFHRGVGRDKDQECNEVPHPAPRQLQHVRWQAKWFAGESVIDPFGGSGTTAVACKHLGITCTLIEVEERFCELAVSRLSQEVLELSEAIS